MADTFPVRSKRKRKGQDPVGLEDAEDDLSLEFFITKRPSDERRSRDVKVTDVGPGPNFLEILIFAVSVCLWLTSAILLGSHVVLLITRTKAYAFMLKNPKMVTFIVLQIISTIVEFSAAVCSTLCCSYDVESHNVIVVAKLAIGLVCCNIGAFVSVVIVGSIVIPSFHGMNTIDPSCSGLCDRGLDIIAHLFMGCSYEGIAINICTIPVLVWVLKEAVVFVKLDLQARNEKAVIKESPSTTDLHHPKRGMRQDSQRRVRFSTSGSSLLDSILPEVKFFKKLPDTPSRIQTNDDNDMREAVIQVMSEEWSHSGASRTVAPAVISYARSKHSSLDSPQEDEERGSADSASSVDPWSTTSSSASDRTKDF